MTETTINPQDFAGRLKRLVPKHIEDLKPYQPGRPANKLAKELGFTRLINLASNENPLGTPDSVSRAVTEALAETSRYPEIGGLALRQALADKHRVKVENVAIGSGSESIMANIARAFLHGNDEALTAEGTFIGFYVIVAAQGAKLVRVPLKNYQFDLAAIASAINENTKIVYLCNPNNPTGTIFNRLQFEAFIKRVPEHVLVILDEAYYEFAQELSEFPDSLHYRLDNVLTLRTFSKAYGMAGLRLGYALGHEHLIGFINKIKLPFEPNVLAQAAGLAALSDHAFLQKTLANNQGEKDKLFAALNKLGFACQPSAANFICIELNEAQKVEFLHKSLLQKGVAIRPLNAFGLPTCVRLTIGLPEENRLLVEALTEIAENI